MLMKTPEFAKARCRITWPATLDRAIDGADAVGIILMAGSQRSFALGDRVSVQHGFMGSDNVSPNGAMLALKGAPIILNAARKMQRYCPRAWLIDFANPVAVHSALVNNHTGIKAMGVCQGYTNHQWDLSRLLGRDLQDPRFKVTVAGINHLSFILRGSLVGQDLFELLDENLGRNWRPVKLSDRWRGAMRRNICAGLKKLVQIYRELGVLIFSTEGDGMFHLFYEEGMERLRSRPVPSVAQIERGLRQAQQNRRRADEDFRSHLDRELDAGFWNSPRLDGVFRREDNDIFVQALKGIAGVATVEVVTSRPNRGAVAGFPDHTVLEYSQQIAGQEIRPAASLHVPDAVRGLIDGLATHQTMLAAAIAAADPRLLRQALLAYPVRPYSRALERLNRDLLRLNEDEIPRVFRGAM